MRVLSLVAVSSFVAGLTLLVAGLTHKDDGQSEASPPFDLRTTEPVATVTPTTPGITPTATSVPFDGQIARMVSDDISGLNGPVEEIGFVANSNQLDAPGDAEHVGWYGMYPKPGFEGNAVFAGHVNFNRRNGPFVNLKTAQGGDVIAIQMKDGPTYTYKVFFYRQYDLETIPMAELIAAPTRPAGEQWITLITCGGEFLADPGSDFGHYLQRDVVIARRVTESN
jgi:hypothetical protein